MECCGAVSRALGAIFRRSGFLLRLMVCAIPMILCAENLSAASYYVATNGSPAASGSLSDPYLSVQDAVDRMGPGDTCYVRAGHYHESVLVQNFSGSSNAPLIIRPYAGEEVVFDGTQELSDLGASNWTQHSGSIYKTTLSEDVWQLFVDGEMMISARWPNNSFDTLWESDSYWGWGNAEDQDGVQYDNPHDGVDLRDLDFSVSNAIAVLNVGNWKTWARMVQAHEPGSDHFSYPPIGDDYKTSWEKHHYFLECQLELLDSPREWFFDPASRQLYLWMPDGETPAGHEIRGKTQDYAFQANDSQHVIIRGFDFFGTTFRLDNSQYVTVEDCDFEFPTFSKRMLNDLSDTEIAVLDAGNESTLAQNTVRNCTYAYTEGPALAIIGTANKVENCYFHHIDFTSVVYGGNAKTFRAYNGPGTIFRRNTIHTTGNTSVFRGTASTEEHKMILELNHFYNTGLMGSDGATIQMGTGADNSIIRYNWTHGHRKYGYRYDGKWELERYGTNGVIHHNLAWDLENCGYRIKGDQHKVYNNLGLNCEYGEIVIRGVIEESLDTPPLEPEGSHGDKRTITRNNAATVICGEKDDYDEPIPGTNDHNWIGYQTNGLIELALRNPDIWDFRPAEGSPLIDAGTTNLPGITDGYQGLAPDVGPYESGAQNYWIPGYRAPKASVPIPADGTIGVLPDSLMWLGGYEGEEYDLYLGTNYDQVATADKGSALYRGSQTNNIYNLGEIPTNCTIFWAVDTVTAEGTVEGDVWSFSPGTSVPLIEVSVPILEDTWVNAGKPAVGNGSATTLRLASESEGIAKYGYLKFSVTNWQTEFLGAKLKIKSNTEPIEDTAVHGVTGTWDDSLTWSNDTLVWGAELSVITNVEPEVWYEYDLGDLVNGNGVYSFGLQTSDGGAGLKWQSAESDNPPELLLYTEAGDTVAPSAPSGLEIAVGSSKCILSWDENGERDLAGYRIYRKLIGGVDFVALNSEPLAALSYTDSALTNDLQYVYLARAVDIAENESSASEAVEGRPNPPLEHWLRQYYPELEDLEIARSGDLDGDGLTGADEYVTQTSPTNARSRFVIQNSEIVSNQLRLKWGSATNRIYSVYKTTNLIQGWTAPLLTNNYWGELDNTNSFLDREVGKRAYYKIDVSVPAE